MAWSPSPRCRPSPEEEAALTRRAPARASAYRALTAAPDTQLTSAAARAAGIGAAALRALVAAGLAERVMRARAPAALPAAAPRPALTPAQRTAADAIAQAVAGGGPACFLLHGITGSGKTEVFLAAAAATLAAGREVVLLVPEIALTHQLVERVRGRFGSEVAVLHSGLGPRERWSEWRRILSGHARVVVGARSAVFAPARRLGLVVVDEEHDAAYKQEEGLRYNARDLAVVRARLAGAVAVLASATPSAESYQAALDGRHRLLTLPERPTAHPLPVVEVVDLRARADDRKRSRLVSEELRRALEANLAAGGQTLVFLNRRGFAVYLQCAGCGAALDCPLCSVTLAWHRAARALVCHHCRHTRRPPATCPACGTGTRAWRPPRTTTTRASWRASSTAAGRSATRPSRASSTCGSTAPTAPPSSARRASWPGACVGGRATWGSARGAWSAPRPRRSSACAGAGAGRSSCGAATCVRSAPWRAPRGARRASRCAPPCAS